MNTQKKDQRRADLAKIHIAKKQIGMDEESYRAMLQMVAGVESAADLDARGRRDVLDHLRKSGFKPLGKTRRHFPGKPDFKSLAGTGKLPMIKKIEAYLAEAKRGWDYAHGTAFNIYKISRVEWCNHKQLRGVITALEKDARRHGRFTG